MNQIIIIIQLFCVYFPIMGYLFQAQHSLLSFVLMFIYNSFSVYNG